MCYAVKCSGCGKNTWAGCGKHVLKQPLQAKSERVDYRLRLEGIWEMDDNLNKLCYVYPFCVRLAHNRYRMGIVL
ncbi:hypothetical protein SUGI_0531410 [Cryptomeria japonica]|nr:hypothetical protein SUGI_0531410 [Cryptomeria japonica]